MEFISVSWFASTTAHARVLYGATTGGHALDDYIGRIADRFSYFIIVARLGEDWEDQRRPASPGPWCCLM
jgi:hypothetical protein